MCSSDLTFSFGDNDPIRFGKLHVSMLTLFQVLTLEGWNDILNTQYHGSDVGYDDAWKGLTAAAGRVPVARPVASAAYFVSFILIGTMIMLNLFTGVIIRSMEEAHAESSEANRQRLHDSQNGLTPKEELQHLSNQLQTIATRLAALEAPPGGSSSKII